MTILSLFDGISCGQVALNRAGINTKKYYASEIDKYAISTTQKNYPNTIQLGNIEEWKNWDIDFSSINMLIGGSPCQDLSIAGKMKGLSGVRSGLFYCYVDILNHIKKFNPDIKFLLENVVMTKDNENIISRHLGIEPIKINSALVSAQNRERLYWTNIYTQEAGLFGEYECKIPQPSNKGILLKDILENVVDKKYFIKQSTLNNLLKHKEKHQNKGNGFGVKLNEPNKKCQSMTVGGNYINDLIKIDKQENIKANQDKASCLTGSGHIPKRIGNIGSNAQAHRVYDSNAKAVTLVGLGGGLGAKTGLYKINTEVRRLIPVECERLQTLPDNYTQGISDTQRYKALGNGWTVDVIAHIFSYLPQKLRKAA